MFEGLQVGRDNPSSYYILSFLWACKETVSLKVVLLGQEHCILNVTMQKVTVRELDCALWWTCHIGFSEFTIPVITRFRKLFYPKICTFPNLYLFIYRLFYCKFIKFWIGYVTWHYHMRSWPVPSLPIE